VCLKFEPQIFEEGKGRYEWKKAMVVEHDTLMKNQTWEQTEFPLGKKPIGHKWVYMVKCKADATLDKYKG
jgi:hypothetical protein